MTINIHKSKTHQKSEITITGSKSESNRLLLLQALYPEIQLVNLGNSDDTQVMRKALTSDHDIVDIHHAGTAMRFLTAYFAIKSDSDVKLTGSSRMKERPIRILVDALNELGADIRYLEKEGCPPLQIKGRSLAKNKVVLKANVSSQYISALLLIAPKLRNGLELILEGEITSMPYIKMTLDLLNQIGVQTHFEGQQIKVFPLKTLEKDVDLVVESDWSSASYYFSIIALSEIGTQITLSSFKENSLQGDSVLAEIYKAFGVSTYFRDQKLILVKESDSYEAVELNLIKSPDIAQTIAVTCLGLGLECRLTGLHTLKIKETDRLHALKTEIEKLGGNITITDESLYLEASSNLNTSVAIDTYNDHRMAMAFAPLALRIPIRINEAEVVSKSYPTFWNDLEQVGFKISK